MIAAIVNAWKTGRTLNMSASGILVGSNETLPPGSKVELMVDWPGFLHGTAQMRLGVFAVVVRSEGSNIAVRLLRHEFRTGNREPLDRNRRAGSPFFGSAGRAGGDGSAQGAAAGGSAH